MAEMMTREAHKKLQQKLEELKKRRAVISKTIGEAREHGDLRENSAYHTAKDEQGLNEMRIKELEAKLEHVTVVDKMPEGEGVRLGSTVKLEMLDSERICEYTLVSAMEADVLENKISPDSPVGGALIGAKVGDVIEVEAPRGLVKYKILEIK